MHSSPSFKFLFLLLLLESPAVKTIIRNFEKGKNESISFEIKGNAKAFDEEKEIRQDLSIRKIESIIVSTVPGTEKQVGE